jgi:hypothetical protein
LKIIRKNQSLRIIFYGSAAKKKPGRFFFRNGFIQKNTDIFPAPVFPQILSGHTLKPWIDIEIYQE